MSLEVTKRILMITLALVMGLAVAVPASAEGDSSDPGKYYYLSNTLRGGAADEAFGYGLADDQVLVGDWDGDASDTLAVRRGRTYYLSNDFKGGEADEVFQYGKTDDEVFVGDWDGDGDDTLAVRRGRTFYVTNNLRGGEAEAVFQYGLEGDVVLVGDWDGDGDDTFAVRRGRTYYIDNDLRGGEADAEFQYGKTDDLVYVGDWNSDGNDTLGVRRGSTYYLNNKLRGGEADVVFSYGLKTDITLVGDWDGNGSDTLGVRRTLHPSILRIFEGSGDDVRSYNLDGVGPAIATISHSGSSNFAVWTYDSNGEESDLLVNEVGNYSGTNGANFDKRYREHRGFDITADGSWRIVVKDASYATAFASSGGSSSGDDVWRAFRIAGDVVTIKHSGESNFAVWAVDSAGERFDLLVNEIGNYSGSQRIPAGTVWLEITADGTWSFSR